MSRPHDSQRSKLYRAENEAEIECQRLGLLPELDGSLAAAEQLARRVVGSRWWVSNARRGKRAPRSVRLTDGGRGMAGAWASSRLGNPEVRLGSKPRQHGWGAAAVVTPAPIASAPIILHELAHTGTPSGLAAHGREFARLNLGLWRRWIGPEAGAILLDRYRANGVKWRAVSSSSTRRPGNPDALAAFRKVSDGDWIVVTESSSGPLYVSNYAHGEPTAITRRRSSAQVWRTKATAERWAAAWAASRELCSDGWRVVPLHDELQG